MDRARSRPGADSRSFLRKQESRASVQSREHTGRGAGVFPAHDTAGQSQARVTIRVKAMPLLVRVGSWRDFLRVRYPRKTETWTELE